MLKTIKLTEEQKRWSRQYVGRMKESLAGYQIAIKQYAENEKIMWEKLREIFPQIAENNTSNPIFDHPEKGDWLITYWDEDK